MAISVATILAFSPGVLVGFILARTIIGALTRSDSDSNTDVHDSTKVYPFTAEKSDADLMATIERRMSGTCDAKANDIEKHFGTEKILVDLQEFQKEAFTHLEDGSTATPASESESRSQCDDNV